MIKFGWLVDYAFGQRKFGGNAQAITKQRWLHHTSLLWDFDPARMQLLKHPSKIPEYRAVRLVVNDLACLYACCDLNMSSTVTKKMRC